MLTFVFGGADGYMKAAETLTSGMVGKEAKLKFSSDWDGYDKTVVFWAGEERRAVQNAGELVTIPHEVLATPGLSLLVGAYGVAPGGKITPTVWVQGPYICPGADPAADPSAEPSLPMWAQLQQELARIREQGMYTLPIGGAELGGVKNGGNVTINEDGTMTVSGVVPDVYILQEGETLDDVPESATVVIDPNGEPDTPNTGTTSGGINISGATVGQTVKIKAVDDNGVPTEWEPVDFPSGGGSPYDLVFEIETKNVEEYQLKLISGSPREVVHKAMAFEWVNIFGIMRWGGENQWPAVITRIFYDEEGYCVVVEGCSPDFIAFDFTFFVNEDDSLGSLYIN